MKSAALTFLFFFCCASAFAQTATPAVSPPLVETGPSRIDVEAKLKNLKNHKDYTFKYDRFKDKSWALSKPHDLLSSGEHMAMAFARGMGARLAWSFPRLRSVSSRRGLSLLG